MTAYDDADLSCPRCTRGLFAEDLCECDHDTGPLCNHCCAVEHRASHDATEAAFGRWIAAGFGRVIW